MIRLGFVCSALMMVGCSGSTFVGKESGNAGTGDAGAGGAASRGGVGGEVTSSGGNQSAAGAGGVLAGGSAGDVAQSGSANGGAAGAQSGSAGAASGGAAGASDAPIVSAPVNAPVAPRGLVIALQQIPEQGPGSYSIEATFAESRGRWDGCTQNRLDTCAYYACPEGSNPYPNISNSPLEDAGTLEFRDTTQPDHKLTIGLIYDYYYEAVGGGFLWAAPGNGRTFAGSGATVPAFEFPLAAPATVQLIGVNGSGIPFSILRSDGVHLTWKSKGRGDVRFGLYGFTGLNLALECTFDASANAGDIPARLLEALEPATDYILTFRAVSSMQKNINGWQLEASLQDYGGDDDLPGGATIAIR